MKGSGMKRYLNADGVVAELTESQQWEASIDDGTGVEAKAVGLFGSREDARAALLQARIRPARILNIVIKA